MKEIIFYQRMIILGESSFDAKKQGDNKQSNKICKFLTNWETLNLLNFNQLLIVRQLIHIITFCQFQAL